MGEFKGLFKLAYLWLLFKMLNLSERHGRRQR